MTAEPVPRIVRPVPGRFGRDPKAPGTKDNTAAALLLAFTLAAILWANSPWADTYWALLDTHVGFTFGDHTFELTVKHLINDGLMTFFFFIVGLEVTSEFAIGQLTDRARAAVPVVAAIAGLTVPAVVFLLFNASGENAQAWGVVISTDTAFLIGALAIIKPKYPARLRIFLLTLAVVDDIGALCVIAIFYSDRIQVVPLVISVALIVALALVRFMPAARGPAYAVLAVALWIALFMAGIHPTLAGVAVALLIPVFTPERQQVEQAVEMIRAFRQSPNSQYARAATRGLRESISINERLQTDVGPYVSFLVLPLFALANAGVRLDANSVTAALRSPLTWGIVAGLVHRKIHRHHRRDMVHAAHRGGATGARTDLAPDRRRRGIVRNRLHHLTFHRRHRDHRTGAAGPGAGRRPAGLSHRVRPRLGDLPDHRLGQPAGTGGAQADPARRPRPRPHPRTIRKPR